MIVFLQSYEKINQFMFVMNKIYMYVHAYLLKNKYMSTRNVRPPVCI